MDDSLIVVQAQNIPSGDDDVLSDTRTFAQGTSNNICGYSILWTMLVVEVQNRNERNGERTMRGVHEFWRSYER